MGREPVGAEPWVGPGSGQRVLFPPHGAVLAAPRPAAERNDDRTAAGFPSAGCPAPWTRRSEGSLHLDRKWLQGGSSRMGADAQEARPTWCGRRCPQRGREGG